MMSSMIAMRVSSPKGGWAHVTAKADSGLCGSRIRLVRIRLAAIEVSHWHSLHDSAYLRHAVGMPDVELVGVQDPSADIAARRAAALGDPPVFTDYREMLERTRPDFVIALGRHRPTPETAHYLLDRPYPFLMEKPMGVDAA